MRSRVACTAFAVVFASLLALASSAAAAISPFCLPGSALGQCNGPQGLAADTETGHVYVADRGNDRLGVFEFDGTPLPVIGAGQLSSPTWVAVDNDPLSASRHDIYVTTASSDFLVKNYKPTGEYVEADSFGQKGTGPCQFEANDPIAAGPGGDVYVASSYDKDGEGPLHDFVNRVIVFDPAGSCLEEDVLFEGNLETIRNFAVDSAGNCYVTVAGAQGVLRKYGGCETLLFELGGTDTEGEAEGIAVDGADSVFAKQRGSTAGRTIFFFTQFSASGAVLKRFGYVIASGFLVPGLAAYSSPEGDLYASEGAAGIHYLKLPPPGPVVLPQPCRVKAGTLGSIRATLQAEVNPEGKASTFHFEYLTQAKYEDENEEFKGFEKTAEIPLPGASDFELHEAAQQAEGLLPETGYRCRVVAKNADSVTPATGEEGSFETEEGFKFGPTSVSGVTETTATVSVEGNPLGLQAKGEIEYVTDAQFQASRFDQALKAPPGEISFGSTETMQLRSVVLSGLAPGTLYHWRLRAKNGNPPGGIVCPRQKPEPCLENEHTFRTYMAEASGADSRGYELVSPGLKNSAEVAVPGNAGGFTEDNTVRIQAGAGSGEAVTYTSFTSFGQAGGAPASSQYLSKRGAGGWVTENMSPFGLTSPIVPPFSGFSGDLRFGAVKVSGPALAPGCQEEVANFYLRDNASGVLSCLSSEAPLNPSEIGVWTCFTYAGASTDGTRAFFAAPVSYAGAPAGNGSLYEWFEGKLRLVSVLPNGEPAPSNPRTSFGTAGGNCQWGLSTMRHVVSADGSKAIWTYVPAGPEPTTSLMVRVSGTETVQLDKAANPANSGDGEFRAASADGSVVYFTAENRLIAGSKSGPGAPDLYRYEFGKPAPLTNLTKASVTNTPADVQGVAGVSEDGSVVYFAAKGALTEEANKAGQKAQEGKDNLYLFSAGKTSFIATLSSEDQKAWESQPRSLSARVSPGGRHLAFLSQEAKALAGYDNTIASGAHCRWEPLFKELVGPPLCPQAFLYDAGTGELSCASCNPSGAKPLGPTLLPGWTNVYEGPRYLSDDGSRLFYESYDALLQADENKKRDVYEFERPGAGSCSAASPNFDPVHGGCHFLISSGRSGDESYLVDASASGRDVFFSTREVLTGWDVNDNFDVYDYREGGGFAEPPPVPVPCVGESCKPPPRTPPAPASPATPAFAGPGNPKPKTQKHKQKTKKQKHKKKTKQKKQQKQKKQNGAQKGRAGR